jgi:hypothetical protein
MFDPGSITLFSANPFGCSVHAKFWGVVFFRSAFRFDRGMWLNAGASFGTRASCGAFHFPVHVPDLLRSALTG